VSPRAAVRWGLQHGLARAVLRRAARAGDPQAMLIMDRATRSDPYPLQDTIRAAGPVVRGRLTYLSASHSACHDILRSADFRTGARATRLPPRLRPIIGWAQGPRVLHPVEPPSLLAVEDPEHARYRRLVSKVFTPRAVQSLRLRVQDTADTLLDDLQRAGGGRPVDLVGAYCTQLPLIVIADILGVETGDRAQVLAFGAGAAPSLDLGLTWREFQHVETTLCSFDTWLGRHLQRLRRHPGTDLLSQLVAVEEDGERLTEAELRAIAGLLLVAGFETTANLLSSGIELLLRHPAQLEQLRSEPARWPNTVEEVLRVESPVQITARVAARDTEVHGVEIESGQVVAVLLSAANRDPAVFADPHRFDVGRVNAREHLAFSAGRHFCLGAALARIEGEVGLRSLVERFPDLALAQGARRQPTRVLRGWQQLPVTLGTPR
jgi:cytochrome P450